MHSKPINLREYVIKARNQLHWTNYRLAKESGVESTQLARWLETSRVGHRESINTATLERILQALRDAGYTERII